MYRLVLILFLLPAKPVLSQTEAVISDLKACDQFYWHAGEIIKKIKKVNDTFTYFHDGELIIFFNKLKTKRLSENTLYVFNHGFNKLITLNILMLEITAYNSKKDKKVIVTSPQSYLAAFHQDSLTRCTHTAVGPMNVQVAGYKKAEISAIFIEVQYYDQHIYKWFLKEPIIPEELDYLRWNIIKK